jgi:hypothetical protein
MLCFECISLVVNYMRSRSSPYVRTLYGLLIALNITPRLSCGQMSYVQQWPGVVDLLEACVVLRAVLLHSVACRLPLVIFCDWFIVFRFLVRCKV